MLILSCLVMRGDSLDCAVTWKGRSPGAWAL